MRAFGISFDDVKTQAQFAAKEKLNFALLSDPDGSVADKFGVRRGERAMASRLTFILDEKGVVRHVFERVSVSTHGADVAAVVKELQAKEGEKTPREK